MTQAAQLRDRVVHVIAGLTAESGGPAYSVPRLAQATRANGVDAQISVLHGPASALETMTIHPRSRYPIAHALAWSAQMRHQLETSARLGSILHSHGLWLMPNIMPSWARRRASQSRLVHSPRGMLAPAARRVSGWKKLPIWWLWQRQALADADMIHATAQSEYEEIRAAGFTNPVAIIPNGVDLPDVRRLPTSETAYPRTVLSLGRIHPKKGLDQLVRAWALVEQQRLGWQLLIIGPSEIGHADELQALASSLNVSSVTIGQPAYGEAKWRVMHSADLFVLPTLNENFGISVAEALAAEMPVIATKGAPWSGLETQRCGWWIDHGVEPLAAALMHATSLSTSERARMGARGRDWMKMEFGWHAIGSQMIEAYSWLRNGGDPPPCVKLA